MRVTLIANPSAGRGLVKGQLTDAVDELRRHGWSIDFHISAGPGDATRLARDAMSDGRDAVVVAGGDGTINHAIQGLVGSNTALGYLPCGTANVWARETGTPLRARDAARTLAEGRIESLDVGIANGRYFLLMAGIGFDAEIVRRIQRVQHHKQRLGILPYVATGIATAPFYRAADLELRYDGLIRRVQALMLVVGNTRLYGGFFYFTPQAVANDGRLDLCIVKGKGPLSLARQSLPFLIRRTPARSDVETVRIRELYVQAAEPVPFQLDGELAGGLPVHVSIAPRALRAIVPRDATSDLIE